MVLPEGLLDPEENVVRYHARRHSTDVEQSPSMKRHIALYPLRASNIEVLGNRVDEASPAWTGLDWSRWRLERPDKLKLSWWHPEDPKLSDLECIYSVYPRPTAGKKWRNRMVKDAWFVQDGSRWLVAVEFERPLPKLRPNRPPIAKSYQPLGTK